MTLVSSTVTENFTRDLRLTFGVRADLTTPTFGTYTCDRTVIVRGTVALECPN